MESANFTVVEELNRNLTMVVLPVTIFIGIEAFIGFFGNILILLIYTKRYERSNFRYFVLSMAVIDLTSCITALPGEIFSQMNWYTYEYGWICKIKSYFNVLTAWGSASILLLLAFDRHRKICKPLAWQVQPSFAKKLCVCSIAISSIVASPIAILWGKQTYIYEHEGLNLTVSICEKSSRYADDIYPLVYIGCVYILPVSIILFVVCTLNIFTARKLFGSQSIKLATKYSISTVSTSQSTLSSIATELDHKTIDNVSSVAKTCLEADCKNKKAENQKVISVSKLMKIVDKENKNNFSNCRFNSHELTETHADVRTRVSFTEERKPSLTTETIFTTEESKTDFHFDIDITSKIVNNNGRKLKSARSTTNTSKIQENGSTRDFSRNSSPEFGRNRESNAPEFRRKQKTVIMLVLTSVFVLTMVMYVVLISFVAGTEGILKMLSNSQKVVFFFFWRLYFINTVINPLLYGFLDPRFRAGLYSLLRRETQGKKFCSKYRMQRKRERPVFTLA